MLVSPILPIQITHILRLLQTPPPRSPQEEVSDTRLEVLRLDGATCAVCLRVQWVDTLTADDKRLSCVDLEVGHDYFCFFKAGKPFYAMVV